MSSSTPSKVAIWAGRVISALAAIFLLMPAYMNLTKHPQAVKGSAEFGYSEGTLLPIGAVLLVSVLLYVIPQTAVLGAILLTGYLGGAVATHVRHGDPLAMMLFPALFGAVVWVGLVLR